MVILKLRESYRKLEEKIEVIEVRLDRVARFETKLQKGSGKKTREKMEKREGGGGESETRRWKKWEGKN